MDTTHTLSYDIPGASKPTFDISTCKLSPEDAIKCLSDEYNVLVPTPNAKPCNNLDEYLFKSTKKTPKNGTDEHTPMTSSRRLSQPSEPFAVPLVRNFERILKKSINSSPSEDSSPKRKKAKQDVFTKTDQIEINSGPLSHLKSRMNHQVKVIIRRRKKVPYVSRVIEYKGTLTMFDKHMNIYLKDVIESFSYHMEGKLRKRGRHRDGIIIRGDNVILVA